MLKPPSARRKFLGFIFAGVLSFLVLPLQNVSHAAAATSSQGTVPKGSKNRENTIPAHFDVLGDGLELAPVELEYDASSESSLSIAGLEVNEKTLSARLIPVKKMGARIAKALPSDEQDHLYFLFQWPQSLISEGNLEMISRSGRVLQKYDINIKKTSVWKETLDRWRALLLRRGVAKDVVGSAPLFRVGFGVHVDPSSSDGPFTEGMEPFRLCLTNAKESDGLSRLCTGSYHVVKREQNLGLALVQRAPSPARVLIGKKVAPLKGAVELLPNKPVQFFAELANGDSFDFTTVPSQLNVIEMTAEPGADTAKLVSFGLRPLQVYRDLPKAEEDFFDRFGFKQTIGDLREFWETEISLKDPVIYMPGPGGGAFKHKMKITTLPSEAMRPYLSNKTVEGTYIDGVKVFGRAAAGTKLLSRQNSVEVNKKSQDFVWRFQAKNRGEVNKSYLTVQANSHDFKAYHEIYKGYPRELSARLSGIVSSDKKLVFMGELAFNYWFEDIFGWVNYYLARQRWGLSAKYFQSLSDFSILNSSSSSANSGPLTITTVDLKYRLSPGLWNRDESWGISASYQQVEFLSFNSRFVGGGVFWARSMPKVFDDIFNLLKIFRYPKWVDAEYIMYVLPMDSSTTVNSLNYALNFHGKVMWTNSFFGEAGFGIKQYGFQDAGTGRKLSFGSLYGTAGLGYSF